MNVLYEFCSKYNANANYILTGEGSPLKDETTEEKLPSKKKRRISKEDASSKDSLMIIEMLGNLMDDMDLLKKQNEALMREILELKKK